MRINMGIIRALSHEAKVIMSILGTGIAVVASNPEMLTTLLTQPLVVSIPLVLPKVVASGAIGSALFNMQKKDAKE